MLHLFVLHIDTPLDTRGDRFVWIRHRTNAYMNINISLNRRAWMIQVSNQTTITESHWVFEKKSSEMLSSTKGHDPRRLHPPCQSAVGNSRAAGGFGVQHQWPSAESKAQLMCVFSSRVTTFPAVSHLSEVDVSSHFRSETLFILTVITQRLDYFDTLLLACGRWGHKSTKKIKLV